MEEQSDNPYRWTVLTNDPSEPPPPADPPWRLIGLWVLKFHPTMNDPDNPKLYALRYWRPEPEKQPNLL